VLVFPESDVYQAYLCFEKRDGGMFHQCPYSSCPCTVDGVLFCSHQLGLLSLLGLAEDKFLNKLSQEESESNLPEDPKLVQDQPVLIENYAGRDLAKRRINWYSPKRVAAQKKSRKNKQSNK
jgi:hypothetical protein